MLLDDAVFSMRRASFWAAVRRVCEILSRLTNGVSRVNCIFCRLIGWKMVSSVARSARYLLSSGAMDSLAR